MSRLLMEGDIQHCQTGVVLKRHLVLAAIVSVWPMSSALAQHDLSEFVHVRPITPQLERLVDTGYRLSTTFRDVVDDLQGTSVIVHLVPGKALPPEIDGALHFVTTASGDRYLRVSVRTDLDFTVLIAVLAHELQHASEIGQAPSVVDRGTLRDHYRLTGVRSCLDSDLECYGTLGARRTGNSVYAEMLSTSSRPLTPYPPR